jgi:hypothetical protein
MLRGFKGQLRYSGLVVIVDRQGSDSESRRLAGHRGRISSKLVTEDMCQAGFILHQSLAKPAKDRFFLLFGLPKDSP